MRGHLARRLVSPLVALVIAAVPADAAVADEQDFKANALLSVVSARVVGDEVFLEAEGQGHSTLLGSFTVTASLGQMLVPGCDPAGGEFTISTDVGTLELQGEALVCFTGVTGAWEFTGGWGEFAGATGGGVFTGTPSHGGQAPLVLHLEGSLSI